MKRFCLIILDMWVNDSVNLVIKTILLLKVRDWENFLVLILFHSLIVDIIFLLDLLNHLIWTGLQVSDVSPFFTVDPDLTDFRLISQCLIPIRLGFWLWRKVSRHFHYLWCYRCFIGCMIGSCFVLLPGPDLVSLRFIFQLFLCFRHFPLSEFMFIAILFLFSLLLIVSWLFFDVFFLIFFIPCLIFNKQSLVLRIFHIKIFFLFIILLILLFFFFWFILLYFKYSVSKIVVFSHQ